MDTHSIRIANAQRRWGLTLGAPFEDATCSWVAPAVLADGTAAVLKIGRPHFEAEHEVAGLRFWNGDGMARLLAADEASGAMLVERCVPGTPLRARPEEEQDIVIAELLRRLWRPLTRPHPFRPLTAMLAFWAAETLAAREQWPDEGLVQEGLRLFEELPRSASAKALLTTDLHAGNVLAAERAPWLAIDPKPFVGDPAYDATQHLLNCGERMRRDPEGTVRRFAELLEVDAERVRLWLFARAAAEPREDWGGCGSIISRSAEGR
jgi:streptomycin 6-kinase